VLGGQRKTRWEQIYSRGAGTRERRLNRREDPRGSRVHERDDRRPVSRSVECVRGRAEGGGAAEGEARDRGDDDGQLISGGPRRVEREKPGILDRALSSDAAAGRAAILQARMGHR
jgi:hypothetical protein